MNYYCGNNIKHVTVADLTVAKFRVCNYQKVMRRNF